MKYLISILFVLFFASSAQATVWYIRSDGGTETQCTGTTDAPYPGSGTGQACAFNHPWWAMGWRKDSAIMHASKMAAGDTLQHSGPTPGVYKMGRDVQWTGCGVNEDCHNVEPPSGTVANPTKIYGRGWNPSATPPCPGYATIPGPARILDPNAQTSWYGINGTFNGTLYLGGNFNAGGSGSANIEIACMDFTDHDPCIIGTGGQGPTVCGPDRTRDGIKGKGNSNITLRYVNSHGAMISGLATTGALGTWTADHVILKNNGLVGWNFASDNGSADDNIATTATFNVDSTSITYSGCGETWPDLKSYNCVGQTNGENGLDFPLANGDGVAFPDATGIGRWKITNSEISYNFQDGFDGLHALNANDHFTTAFSTYEGNNGQAIKVNSNSEIENSFIIGDCNYFYQQPFTVANFSVSRICRALGTPLSLGFGNGQVYKIYNSTIYSIGDVTVSAEGSGCSGLGDKVISRNTNYLLGRAYWDDSTFNSAGGDKTSTLFYLAGSDGNGSGTCGTGANRVIFDSDYLNVFGSKGGAGDIVGQAHSRYTDPLLIGPINRGPTTYSNDQNLYTHFYLSSTSPLRSAITGANAADESLSFITDGSVDFNHFSRTSSWDGGAVEYGSTPSCIATGSICTTAGQCCSNICSSTTNRCVTTPTCTDNGNSCSVNGDCCSGNCSSGTCAAVCTSNTGTCSVNANCCSGNCSSGICRAQPLANGSACGANSDCQSNICDCNNLCASANCTGGGNPPNTVWFSGSGQCTGSINLQ